MIRFIFAAVWICVASIGAVVYSYQSSLAKQSEAPPPPFFGGMTELKTDVISVPVFKRGAVEGYFLARLAYMADTEELNKLSIPPQSLLVDEIYTYLFGNPQIDWADKKEIDLAAFRNGLRDSINKRVGKDLIHDVVIEQLDYLMKSEIRDNAARRRLGPSEKQAAAEPEKKTGH